MAVVLRSTDKRGRPVAIPYIRPLSLNAFFSSFESTLESISTKDMVLRCAIYLLLILLFLACMRPTTAETVVVDDKDPL